ncbi:HAMP domain-containing protein [Marinomonas agarivorans]|nr:HAMP domain-containing protein [Marinomonas agarivorans]
MRSLTNIKRRIVSAALPNLRFPAKLLPQSLAGQILIILTLGVALAQLASSTMWLRQLNANAEKNVREVAQPMAFRVAATISYFSSLPKNYRHIVIDQLQEMGGTRFFVTVNTEEIQINALPQSPLADIVINEFRHTLAKQLGITNAKLAFSKPNDLHVINNQVRLVDLPERWGHHSLLVKPLSPPILVIQIPINEKDWLYLATLMPDPYFLDKASLLSTERLLSLTLSIVTVLLLGLFVIRRITKPLAKLAQAAESFGQGADQVVDEIGSKEIRNTAHAFNQMQERIQRYLDDRERLFAAISHDLKTPITRLRLRAEFVDNDNIKYAMVNDLEDLDMLVKGALQSVKETDIHENRVEINIGKLLADLKNDAKLMTRKIQIKGTLSQPYIGKPLAIKRCLTNLVDNALYYGKGVQIELFESDQTITINILDEGPGIPQEQIDKMFQPYTRLDLPESNHPSGMGLGLSIARNIARAHGGEVTLKNRQQGGLEAKLTLPLH